MKHIHGNGNVVVTPASVAKAKALAALAHKLLAPVASAPARAHA